MTVESGCGEGCHHDEYNAHHPSRKLPEQQEEGEITISSTSVFPGTRPCCKKAADADKRENAENGNGGNASSNPQVFICLGGEGTHPESGQEEVVRQNGDGEDVDQLPAKKAGLQIAGLVDQATVNVGFHTDRDNREDDQTNDHGTLDDIGNEGHLEAAESYGMSESGTSGFD